VKAPALLTPDEAAELPYEEQLRLAGDPRTHPAVLGAIQRALLTLGFGDSFFADPFADDFLDDPTDESLEWAKKIRAALAGNPNTAPLDLAYLAPEFPAEFCANPVAPLLSLEWPEFVEHLSYQRLPALLRRADVPASLIAAIAAYSLYGSSRAEAMLHVAYSGVPESQEGWRGEARAALRALAEDDYRHGGRYAATRLRQVVALGIAPAWLCEVTSLRGLGIYRKPDKELAKLRRKVTTESLTGRLPWSDNCPVRCFILAGQRQKAKLRLWADSDAWTDRFGVLLNPRSRTLPDILTPLTEDSNRLVRAAACARLAGEEVAL
jgi:hypothetical protein